MPEENLSSKSAWNSLPVNWCINKLGPIITEMGTKYMPQFSHTCHSIESLRHISGISTGNEDAVNTFPAVLLIDEAGGSLIRFLHPRREQLGFPLLPHRRTF
ncbi:predicted protein [Chaetomium globosum CBS 148.51]|uniref:Uncharacterized protein n=1 Tax=Chaetomium globosum (strain ATCC 6205 / CBS 148.51 / DSM 1962 / NBRC 6347 / NRRL 1970) TaxID=306901 RepID=Q2H8Z6_CHAGB|nr:uncharacterized protein CHGG_03308 [Chaetomium globosum CBS 148.51]EAQ91373.1 predicted protein [Chaetomium globosum CBS 148.51]